MSNKVGREPCRVGFFSGRAGGKPILGLETFHRIDVWPDSIQVLGGTLSFGLPTRLWVWLTSGLLPAGHRDEAWLQRGLPCS